MPFLGPPLGITLHIYLVRTCYNFSGFYWPGHARINSDCVSLIADKVTPGPGAYNPVKARNRVIFGYAHFRKIEKESLQYSTWMRKCQHGVADPGSQFLPCAAHVFRWMVEFWAIWKWVDISHPCCRWVRHWTMEPPSTKENCPMCLKCLAMSWPNKLLRAFCSILPCSFSSLKLFAASTLISSDNRQESLPAHRIYEAGGAQSQTQYVVRWCITFLSYFDQGGWNSTL